MSIVQAEILEPYAQALMSVAQEHNLTDAIGEDMRGIIEVLKNSEDLQQVLSNPFIKDQAKKDVLGQIMGEGVQHFTRNFVMLLVDRRRAIFLEGIAQQYLALLRKLNQTVLAEVTAAVELNEGQKDAIRDKVRAISSARDVELDTKIDPEIIGGVIIKVGSQVLDASLRGQLRRIGISLSSV